MRTWLLCAALGAAQAASAHSDAHDALPDQPGAKLGASVAWRSLSASDPLPSQGLPGYLLLGDPGVDARGAQLEHGTVQLGWRFMPGGGAHLALGWHGRDPMHVEAAWLQFGGIGLAQPYVDWTLAAGRNSPSLGPVMTPAGHFDRFGLMPLAKQATTDGDWVEDGVELGVQHEFDADTAVKADLGLWSGRFFPGAKPGGLMPSLHLGGSLETSSGAWSMDGFAAQARPSARGSRLNSTTGAHSHTAPVCDARLDQVLCFDGRTRLAGLSARWDGHGLPFTVTGAVMWRDERGSLESRNGLADYHARTRGDWLDAIWRIGSAWDLGLRHERLTARHTLIGPGANLLADEAGFGRYAAQRRSTVALGHMPWPGVQLRVEAGREAAGTQRSRFLALRLVLDWEHSVRFATPNSATERMR